MPARNIGSDLPQRIEPSNLVNPCCRAAKTQLADPFFRFDVCDPIAHAYGVLDQAALSLLPESGYAILIRCDGGLTGSERNKGLLVAADRYVGLRLLDPTP